jgi:dienelactone hydrolase
MTMVRAISRFAVLLVLAGACAVGRAQVPTIDSSLNESVVMVPKGRGLFSVELETTLYKPDGEGPFPVALINHGKASGDPRFQGRYRPAPAARYFLQRGYAVVVPMRQGFSRSSGTYIGGGCNVESNGRAQAEDVIAALDWLRTQPWADMGRIVVIGQSHGGWTTLAFGAAGYPGVKGLVNFAGGLRQDGCPNWKEQLASAAGAYAKTTKLPSLWFYGDNDSYFDPPTWQAMHTQYEGAGGQAKLVAFGRFGSDSHSLFGSSRGGPIWEPEMTAFLQSVGMPYERGVHAMKFSAKSAPAGPAATNFAALADDARIPFLGDNGRNAYKGWLAQEPPRAFAISPQGAWGWAYGGDDPLKRALDNCNKQGKGACRLYAVDDRVVWVEGKE